MSNKFPECDTCLNREFDPFQCTDCQDASNYEANDLNVDDGSEQEMSYSDFVHWIKAVT